ncbi:MAG: HAD family hydrolase [Clostridia bacterium]|nr:HAD family hydrolase [Clostridia bacterium]
MSELKNVKTIFLDYDGTLHNSIGIYGPAFRKAYEYLVTSGLAPNREWRDHEISKWLGYSPREMWQAFMPDLATDERTRASQIISDEMQIMIESGRPLLYDGALETLQYLKDKGYKLVFISNCRERYMESHNKTFSLDRYFENMYCSESYDYAPKYEIFKRLRPQFPEEMVIIGDRFQDMEVGYENGIHTVACTYGFGTDEELSGAEHKIDSIEALRSIL